MVINPVKSNTNVLPPLNSQIEADSAEKRLRQLLNEDKNNKLYGGYENTVYEKSDEVKSSSAIIKETHSNVDAFKKMVHMLLETQAGKHRRANPKEVMVNISPEIREAAQEMISEDGYFGVKQTSERILSFARAMANGDPANLSVLKDAVMKGYKEAEKMWGDDLPDICKQTLEAVMKGFEEMEIEFGANR